MTEPEAVAIRYDKLKTAPKGVAGSWPVVVFTEQDQVLAQASLFPETEAERAPSIASEIRNLIFVLDSSSSMTQRAGGGTSQSKFDYLKSQFKKLSPEILESSKVHFIEFSSEATAEEVDLSSGDPVSAVNSKIDAIAPLLGTNFSNAFKLAVDIVAAQKEASGGDSPMPRSLILMFTDGMDNWNSREFVPGLAETLRDLNCGAFLMGIGADYDLKNLVDISARLGYSGWAHAPIAGNSDDLFSRFVLPLVNEMRSSELYLKLEAEGDFNNLMSLTPSVKPIEGSVDHIGYQRESISILFEKSRNSSLHLHASADVSGEDKFLKDIPIIDWQDAPSLFEKVEAGRNALAHCLVFLAQLNGDTDSLKDMKRSYPTLAPLIDDFLSGFEKLNEKDSRQATWLTMSKMGNFKTEIESKIPPYLHSGELGPLSLSPGESLPPAEIFNPRAYDEIPTQISVADRLIVDGVPFSLTPFRQKGECILGRSNVCDIRLLEPAVSRCHCRLTFNRLTKEVMIEDLRSKNGVYVNGAKIEEAVRLNDGDKIEICGITIKYTAGA